MSSDDLTVPAPLDHKSSRNNQVMTLIKCASSVGGGETCLDVTIILLSALIIHFKITLKHDHKNRDSPIILSLFM